MHVTTACTRFEPQCFVILTTTLAFDTVGHISGPQNNASTMSSLNLYSTYKNTFSARFFFFPPHITKRGVRNSPKRWRFFVSPTLPQAWCGVVITSTPKKVWETAQKKSNLIFRFFFFFSKANTPDSFTPLRKGGVQKTAPFRMTCENADKRFTGDTCRLRKSLHRACNKYKKQQARPCSGSDRCCVKSST